MSISLYAVIILFFQLIYFSYLKIFRNYVLRIISSEKLQKSYFFLLRILIRNIFLLDYIYFHTKGFNIEHVYTRKE